MTQRRAILSGSTFEERIGYARAGVHGDEVHVSGTTGFDHTTVTVSEDVAGRHHAGVRPGRSPHEDRDRGVRAAIGPVTACAATPAFSSGRA